MAMIENIKIVLEQNPLYICLWNWRGYYAHYDEE